MLLVDDDVLVLNSLQTILATLGHRVTACLNGEAALAILEAGAKPNVVLLDMNMPGLGGTDIANKNTKLVLGTCGA